MSFLDRLSALYVQARDHLNTPAAERTSGQRERLDNLDRAVRNATHDVPLVDLRDERPRQLTVMEEITSNARAFGRAVTDEEQGRYDEARWIVEQIDGELARRQEPANPEWSDPPSLSVASGGSVRTRRGEVPVLARSERLADLYREQHRDLPVRADELSFGRWLRGLVTGNWRDADAELEVFRTYGTAPDTAGGVLVPSPLAMDIIDLARNAAVVMRAGARTVPMESKTLDIGRVAGDPTAGWKAENATGTFTAGSYERVTFTAKTLVAMIKGSVEGFEDATPLTGQIESALASALALELDRAALRGSGVDPEPIGVRNAFGVTIDPLTAPIDATTKYTPFSEAVQTIWSANGQPNAVIYSPRTAGAVDRLADTTGQPLQPPQSFRDLERFVTNQIPENIDNGTGPDETEAYVADFSQLMVGMRTQLVLEATRVGGASDGSAFKDLQVWIRAYLRADIQLAHPEHFVVVTEINP